MTELHPDTIKKVENQAEDAPCGYLTITLKHTTIRPMANHQRLKDAADKLSGEHPIVAEAVRTLVESHSLYVKRDQIQDLGRAVKKATHGRDVEELFENPNTELVDWDAKKSWYAIGNCIKQQCPDYEPTEWENYSSEGGYLKM